MVLTSEASIALEQLLENLGTLALHLHQITELDEILSYAVGETRELLGSDRVLVYRFLPHGDGVIIAESIGEEWPSIVGQSIHDPCFQNSRRGLYCQGLVRAIADVETSDLAPCHINFLKRLQIKANLVAPILVKPHLSDAPGKTEPDLWGLLIGHQCSAPRVWQPLEIQILKQIAIQLGAALHRVELQRQLHQHQTSAARWQVALGAAEDGIWNWNSISRIDVTNLKRAESLLHLQSTALAACADAIVITDRQGTIEWVNPAFIHLTGYSVEEAIGKNPRDLVKSNLQSPEFYRQLWAVILAGEVWRGELVNRRKDGSLYNEEMTITPVRNQQNAITHFIAIKQDITERKHIEQLALQQSERDRILYAIAQDIHRSFDLNAILKTAVGGVRQLLQTDRVIIYCLNPDWSGVVLTESVASKDLSILAMEIADSYLMETQARDYHDGEINVIPDVYTAGLSPCHLELLEHLQIRAKLVVPLLQTDRTWGFLIAHHCSGPYQWQPVQIDLLRSLSVQLAIAIQQSELYHQVQTLNNDLELQVQERTAQLQQSLGFESLLKRITDKVRDSLDEHQILQAVIQELAQGLHIEACDTGIYNAEQTTSTIAYEFVNTLSPAQGCTFAISDAPHPEAYFYLLQGQVCQFCDFLPNSLRSQQRLLTVLACPIVDDQGVLGDLWLFKPREAVFNDLEVRLVQQVANQCAIALRQSRLYQSAQQQVRELERLNQLKDDFLSTVSHELRTPMSNIKMATQMLEIYLQPLEILNDESSLTSRYFQILKTECQRETQLINDLLNLTRLDANTEPLHLTSIDLRFLLPHIAEPFQERTQQQQQQLLIEIPENIPFITTDLSYLERSLTELLNNACKYTPEREIIRLSVQLTSTALAIEVSNSGVEISAEECDRIFEKFYRIPNNDPWKYGGTGLGLALVRRMLRRLGGTIAVRSQQKVTTFTVQLPLKAE